MNGAIEHAATCSVPGPVIEMCLRSDRYDQELTFLHFESNGPRHQEEEEIRDSFDRFMEN
jgi:hypothetical protein